MSVQINYISKINAKSSKSYVFFANEKFEVSNLKNVFSKEQISFIQQIIKKKDLKKRFLSFDLNLNEQIILIKTKKNISSHEIENLGAEFHNFIKLNSIINLTLYSDSLQKIQNRKEAIEEFLLGLKLKSYEFNLYKSKKKLK